MIYTIEDENGERIAMVDLEARAEKQYFLSIPLFPNKIFIPCGYLNLRAIKPFFAEHSTVTRMS